MLVAEREIILSRREIIGFSPVREYRCFSVRYILR
jgi:hypothetical protein